MAEGVLGLGVELPTLGAGGGITGSAFGLIAFSILLLFCGAVAIYFIHMYTVYNRKIIVFENVSGQGFQPVFKDRARLVKVGDGGEELLFLMKKKVYRTAYGRKMGKNTFWFAVGQDGYWYNVVLGDIDAKMGMLDIEPIDRDMRYMHVAIRKNIQERYKKENFMSKYGAFVFNAFIMLIFLVGAWFLFDKIADVSANIVTALRAMEATAQSNQAVLNSLENLCAGGSGFEIT